MYQILITPLISGFIAQICKLFIKSNRVKFDWESISTYSGMPSSHSAITVSLTTTVGLFQGISSPLFAACFIFSVIIIRDALGIRRYVGQHSEILNDLIKDLRKDNVALEEKYPRLVERVGHTPAQIIVGSLIGFIISLASYYIF
jgi:uncharacterized protein